jgi:hypothetical protein
VCIIAEIEVESLAMPLVPNNRFLIGFATNDGRQESGRGIQTPSDGLVGEECRTAESRQQLFWAKRS